MRKLYQAEYEDDNIEVFSAEDDDDACFEAWDMEEEHGSLLDLFEVNGDYEKIRTVV